VEILEPVLRVKANRRAGEPHPPFLIVHGAAKIEVEREIGEKRENAGGGFSPTMTAPNRPWRDSFKKRIMIFLSQFTAKNLAFRNENQP
jgi:hypothetical protein